MNKRHRHLHEFRFGFSSAVTFDAMHLDPGLTWAFLVHLSYAVFIQGHDIDLAVPNALGQSTDLGHHSGVYIMTSLTPTMSDQQKAIVTTRYRWSHRDTHPWGKPIPAQCPQCFTPQSWLRSKHKDSTYIFTCKYHKCGLMKGRDGRARAPARFVAKKPVGVEILHQGKGRVSAWLRFRLPPFMIIDSV